jgi:hypothetical protein
LNTLRTIGQLFEHAFGTLHNKHFRISVGENSIALDITLCRASSNEDGVAFVGERFAAFAAGLGGHPGGGGVAGRAGVSFGWQKWLAAKKKIMKRQK